MAPGADGSVVGGSVGNDVCFGEADTIGGDQLTLHDSTVRLNRCASKMIRSRGALDSMEPDQPHLNLARLQAMHPGQILRGQRFKIRRQERNICQSGENYDLWVDGAGSSLWA